MIEVCSTMGCDRNARHTLDVTVIAEPGRGECRVHLCCSCFDKVAGDNKDRPFVDLVVVGRFREPLDIGAVKP